MYIGDDMTVYLSHFSTLVALVAKVHLLSFSLADLSSFLRCTSRRFGFRSFCIVPVIEKLCASLLGGIFLEFHLDHHSFFFSM
ncbi:hypothetical protein BJ508DRAFT_69007 [Ascobolus immersus RN42]|uniref:Uncharacterized protein n=1 Tax=Ascobolus immersus RN42 TaxID=1160509 RepID=A0A3N4HKG5_ASCIM|nr:hypothetical protein BJ508DRAFT_69007 [Ascobolus immersus RN42]